MDFYMAVLESRALQRWYGLWMRVKDLHNYTVVAFDSCVKWPLVSIKLDNFDAK
jgi:hypothetical protein